MIPETMKAVVLTERTQAEKVGLTSYPVPRVRPGWVLVKVKTFGMNHSEQILRLREIQSDYIQKPIIPGIECVGGMGRSFHGSYAEYALLPAHHVFAVQTGLSWEEMAAVPETYFTAWGSLFECLRLMPEDTLLIRGGTCALGYAALQIAKALGCRVIATTHREGKLSLLAEADEAVLDDGRLAGKVHGAVKVLDLVGPRNLKDTLAAVEKGGVVCSTGILGGVYALNGFDPIKDIPNGVYLTGFFSNYPTQQIMSDIFTFLEKRGLLPMVGAKFDFSHIKDACIALDTGRADGKIIVTV